MTFLFFVITSCDSELLLDHLLIAALIFSAGYYSAPNFFFTIQRIWIVLGRCLFTTRRGVLRFCRILRLEEEYWDSAGFYDSKRSIEIRQVFTTRRGVLRFYRFLRLEEEYWDSTGFYDSKRSIEILQVFFSRKQVCSWLEYWLLCVRAFTSIFDCWLLFSNIGL